MQKKTGPNELNSLAIQGLKECAADLAQSRDVNLTLKKELAECKEAQNSDKNLLASGLRLAFENQALEIKIAALRKEAASLTPPAPDSADVTNHRPCRGSRVAEGRDA